MTETIKDIKTIGSLTIYEACTPEAGEITKKMLKTTRMDKDLDVVFNKDEATHIFINSYTEKVANYERITTNRKKILQRYV